MHDNGPYDHPAPDLYRRVRPVVMRVIWERDGKRGLTHTVRVCSMSVYANQPRHR